MITKAVSIPITTSRDKIMCEVSHFYRNMVNSFSEVNLFRDHLTICTDLQIRTTFRFQCVGGFEEAGSSDFGPGINFVQLEILLGRG